MDIKNNSSCHEEVIVRGLVREANDLQSTRKCVNEKIEIVQGKIYKYYPLGNYCPPEKREEEKIYSIKNLEDQIIYLSRVTDFNDPFDTNMSLPDEEIFSIISQELPIPNEPNDEIMKLIHSYKEKHWAELEAKLTSDKAYYVSCFSSEPDNILMWSHYADKHKGFCIEYNLRKSTDYAFLVSLLPVIYSSHRPTIPRGLVTTLFDVSKREESTEALICAALTKSKAWEYEKEWRFTYYDSTNRFSNRKFPIDCISKVILGCKTAPQYKDEIKGICKSKGFALSAMILDEDEYDFHEESIL